MKQKKIKKVLIISGALPNKMARLRSIKKGFEVQGIQTDTFCYRRFYFNHSIPTNWLIQRSLFYYIKKTKPDLLFVIKGESLAPNFINKVKKEGIICINWFIDDVFGVHNPFLRIKTIAEYDFIFGWDKYMIEELNKRGLPAYYLPVGSPHDFYYPLNLPYKYDVSFIGSYYESREEELKKICDLPLTIFGTNWYKCKDTELRKKINFSECRQETYRKVINESKILLNFHHKQSILSTNMRTPEVTSCKGFLLCSYNPVLEEMYKIGEEIDVFHSIDELRDKIKYYLKYDKERESIALKGYNRTLKEHKIEDRMKEIIHVINSNN